MPALCPQCDNRQSANKKALLQQHMKSSSDMATNHPPTYCTVCVKASHTPVALEDYYCGSPAHSKYDRCRKGFKDAPACEEYHRTSRPKTPCLSCGGMAFYEDALDQHQWVSVNNPWCTLCDAGFKDDTTYAEHVSSTHAKLQYFDTTKRDHLTTEEQCGDLGSTSASGASTSSNMFSNYFCFIGGSYYHVRGDAHFSPPPSQIPFGLKILHQNISASACHDSRERFPPPRCHPSTRKEILDTIKEHIKQTPPSFNILHLFGSEGTGKSAIAQTIAEYYKPNGTLGACFFFSRESHERNTDKNLIATLAYQLCVNIPGLRQFIVKAVEDDLSMFQKDVDTQIERLIMNPLVEADGEGVIHGYPIIIVVDGIDECEDMKEQHAFLEAISGAMGRHNLPLYFVITSRPEAHIVDCLNQEPCPTWHRLDLDLNPTHTKTDIEVYVRSEFERIRRVHHIPESFVWPSQTSIQILVSETKVFRDASKIMAFIDDQKDTPPNRLEGILRNRLKAPLVVVPKGPSGRETHTSWF